MHERKRQAAVRGEIAYLERQRRAAWRRFRANVKGELDGSPRWDACWRRLKEENLELQRQVQLSQLHLPPHTVWNPKGWLERIAVNHP